MSLRPDLWALNAPGLPPFHPSSDERSAVVPAPTPATSRSRRGAARERAPDPERLSLLNVDEGPAIAYTVLHEGVPVYAADGSAVGTVEHVVAAAGEDIFHGLVIRTAGGSRFVSADQVGSLHERGADLRIDAASVAVLPHPHGAAPDLQIGDPTTKTRRWREVLDMVSLKGYLSRDWRDEN